MAAADEGVATIISGRSRSGKSAWAKQAVAGFGRVVVWDPDDEWPGRRVTSLRELAKRMWGADEWHLRFVPPTVNAELHGAWAALVLAWGQSHDGVGVHAVSDELADVTSPGKAAAGWGQLVRRGLKRGIWLYSISQRWAEADKSAFGNCSRVVAFASSSDQDVRYLSSRVRVPADVLSGLRRLEYVDYSTVTGDFAKKTLRFELRKPVSVSDTASGVVDEKGADSRHLNRPSSGLLLE